VFTDLTNMTAFDTKPTMSTFTGAFKRMLLATRTLLEEWWLIYDTIQNVIHALRTFGHLTIIFHQRSDQCVNE